MPCVSRYSRATSGTAPSTPVNWLRTQLAFSFSALMAPMSMLFEMFSRWPRYLSHGPAIEMWSVVVLPSVLMSTGMSRSSAAPPNGANGASSCSRSDAGSTTTSSAAAAAASAGGAWNVSSPGSKPRAGSTSTSPGGARRNSVPSAAVSVSRVGSKSRRPASASAVTISGDVTNACVFGFASLRAVKLRLYDVTIVFAAPCGTSSRRHWPMHGPHALASTVPPTRSSVSMMPSRAIVARTCSLPGVIVKPALARTPRSSACAATAAERPMSSYDEFVQLPMRPTLTSSGHCSARAVAASLSIGVARSGVNGPFTCGRSRSRSISITWSYTSSASASASARSSASARASHTSAIAARRVARRYAAVRSVYGNTDVVAPISAPMLQMVPAPVAEIESTPGPKYSTMWPVPPDTVRMPATRRMTSLGDDQPPSLPVRRTPISLGALSSHARPAITSTASAPPTPIATMPRPPAFGVWLSVPMTIPPGNA
mmetsp:Transcript_33676/g.82632  ORF Transcript_33676/g.82632 Transcript_33676/m.82632 type:complete len:486 (+) Transcript_33676:505-1962(+)